MTTNWRAHLFLILLSLVVATTKSFAEDLGYPKFRHVDVGAAAPLESPKGVIKLLADADFAPFSFKNNNGEVKGISIEIAQSACAELRLQCEIITLPFAELLPALIRGDGAAIITGVRTNAAVLEHASMTRPYFFSSGRFIARVGTPFATPDVISLTRGRIGLIKGTSHQAFLEKYYSHSTLIAFPSEAEMFEALRTGKVDVAFTDSMRASFWLKGTSSRNCCINLGAGFIDRTTFSRGLTFLVRQDQKNLRETFDFALDRLEEKEVTSKIFARYLPDSAF
jgi:polar amino acid transport system substrate-binding protein